MQRSLVVLAPGLWLAAGLWASGLCAQSESPPAAGVGVGVIQGDLLEIEGGARAGVVSVRTGEAKVIRCAFDEKTYFERERVPITSSVLRAGDRLEIISDRGISSAEVCAARTVHVLDPITAERLRARPGLRSFSSNFDLLAPRGNLTFAGVVTKVEAAAMIIRTREAGAVRVLLRPDTRYLAQGQPVEPGALKVNTHVFVRAGRNFDEEIEAFQVVWGTILLPQ